MPTTLIPSRPLLSARASSTPSSAIRDLLDQANRPGMISLAGGLPDVSQFPVRELAHITAEVLADAGPQVLQYGPTRGDEAVRASLASLFSGASADDLVVTTGSQQALDLIARSMLDPGDEVVVGDPEYLGALQVFRSYGADLCPIAIDADGLDTEQLEDRLQWGLRPKLCYVVPHFHNPTGATMSPARRAHLDELSVRYGFVIVEDDPYRDLYYDDGAPAESLGDSSLTVQLRSTSKVLTPGLRVGVMAGPSWLIDAAITAKQSCDLHSNSLAQAVVARAIEADWFGEHVDALRVAYRLKRDVLVEALRRELGDTVGFVAPAGGMFLWARFGHVRDTADWLGRCLDENVCFVPGAAFAVTQDLANYARLSFATSSPSELQQAVKRMASVA